MSVVGTPLDTGSNMQEERFSSVSGNLENQNVTLVKEQQEEMVAVTPISSSHQCDDCQKTFKSSVYLEIHTIKKHAKFKFKCFRCDRSFSTGKQLRYHEDIRYWRKTSCSQCNTIFCTSKELLHHTESFHSIGIEDKKRMAEEANEVSRMSPDKKLADQCELRRLKRTCHICHKMFSAVSQVKRHVLTEHELTNRKHCPVSQVICMQVEP